MRSFIRAGLLPVLFAAVAIVCGCGGNSQIGCTLETVITVSPTSATVNHAAAPPANQVQFIGVGGYAAPPGEDCAVPALSWIAYGTWSNPDPTDITISSADDSTNGTAVCVAPTNGAVTLTGTFPSAQLSPQSVTKSVQLTCE